MPENDASVNLTRRERAVLDCHAVHGELNEGLIAEDCWPLVRNVRLVTNSLVRKGLVTLGPWWDGAGYELLLTDAGRREVADSSAR